MSDPEMKTNTPLVSAVALFWLFGANKNTNDPLVNARRKIRGDDVIKYDDRHLKTSIEASNVKSTALVINVCTALRQHN